MRVVAEELTDRVIVSAEAKHAAGPWFTDGSIKLRTVDGYPTSAVAVGSHGCARAIALVFAGFGDGPATANLIGAAPDLLRELEWEQLALHEVLPLLKHGSSEKAILEIRYEANRTAIAKAKGESC